MGLFIAKFKKTADIDAIADQLKNDTDIHVKRKLTHLCMLVFESDPKLTHLLTVNDDVVYVKNSANVRIIESSTSETSPDISLARERSRSSVVSETYAGDFRGNPEYYSHLEILSKRDLTTENHSYDPIYTGRGVDCYVIDTGVKYDHPLLPNVHKLESFKSGYVVGGVRNSSSDDNGHGTEIALFITGTMCGVARDVNIFPLKVVNRSGSGNNISIAMAIDEVIEHHLQKDNDHPSIINYSLGMMPSPNHPNYYPDETGDDIVTLDALKLATTFGIHVICAAGNGFGGGGSLEGPMMSKFTNGSMNLLPREINNNDPGQGNPIVVGATHAESSMANTQPSKMASFSNYGHGNTINAPGYKMIIPRYDWKKTTYEKYRWRDGTSFSCPVVVGLVSLYLQENPSASVGDVKSWLIKNSSKNLITNLMKTITLPKVTFKFVLDSDEVWAEFEDTEFTQSQLKNKKIQIIGLDDGNAMLGFDTWYDVIQIQRNKILFKLGELAQFTDDVYRSDIKLSFLDNTHESTDGIIKWQKKSVRNRIILKESIKTDEYFELFNVDNTPNRLAFNPYIKTKIWFSNEFGSERELQLGLQPEHISIEFILSEYDMGLDPKFSVLYEDDTEEVVQLSFDQIKHKKYYYKTNFTKKVSSILRGVDIMGVRNSPLTEYVIKFDSTLYDNCDEPQTQLLNYFKKHNRENHIYSFKEYQTVDNIQPTITKVISIYAADFYTGTLRITKPGYYHLMEDVVFHPNEGNDFFPTHEQIASGLYPMGRGGAYHLGFFAAVTVECDGVMLNLNGHTIEQSKMHNLQQRFFSIIELANAPFIPSQGPHSFGDSFSPAKNVLIFNGKLGLSSHHGIHGNLNEGVVLSNLEIKNFEVAGIALNGATTGVISNVSILGTQLKIPVNSMFSQSVFIKRHLEQIKSRLQSSDVLNMPSCGHTKANLPNKTKVQTTFTQSSDLHENITLNVGDLQLTLDDILSEISRDINEVRESVLKNEPIKNYFNNETGLYDGNMYGLVLHVAGVVVHDFLTERTSESVGNEAILLHEITIKNIKSNPVEILAVETAEGKLQTGPFGDVFNVMFASRMNRGRCEYVGNSLANAQLFLEKYEQYGISSDLSKIESCVLMWAEGNLNLSSILSDEGLRLIPNHDSMGHVMKGNIGMFISGGVNHTITDVCIDGVKTQGRFRSNLELVGNADIKSPAHYGGASSNGVLITASKNLNFNNMKLVNVDSEIKNAPVCDTKIISGENIIGIKESCIMENNNMVHINETKTCISKNKLDFEIECNAVEEMNLKVFIYSNTGIIKRYTYKNIIGQHTFQKNYKIGGNDVPIKLTAILTPNTWSNSVARHSVKITECNFIESIKSTNDSNSTRVSFKHKLSEELDIVVRLLANKKIIKTKRFKKISGVGDITHKFILNENSEIPNEMSVFVSKDSFKNRVYSDRVGVKQYQMLNLHSEKVCVSSDLVEVGFEYDLPETMNVVFILFNDKDRIKNFSVKNLTGVGNKTIRIEIPDNKKIPTRLVALVTKGSWKDKIAKSELTDMGECQLPKIMVKDESVCIHNNTITSDIDFFNADKNDKIVINVLSATGKEQTFYFEDISVGGLHPTGTLVGRELKLRKNFKPKKIVAFLTKNNWKNRKSQHKIEIIDECNLEKVEDDQMGTMFTPVCPDDVRLCKDGHSIARDPRNNCEFPACVDDGEVPSCTEDAMVCENGHVVGRNPFDECNWYPCDKVGILPPPVGDNDLKMCTTDVKYCKDGSVVSRDHQNDCKFFMCPEDYRHGGGEDEPVACTRELKICPDGTAVGRDSFNNCNFHACPDTDEIKPPVIDDRFCTKDLKMCESGFMVGRDPHNDCEWEVCPPSIMNGIYLNKIEVSETHTEQNVEIVVDLLEGTTSWKYKINNEDEVIVQNKTSLFIELQSGIYKIKVWGIDSTEKQVGRIFYEKIDVPKDVFAPEPEPVDFDEDLFAENKKLWEDTQIDNYSYIVSRSFYGPPNSWKPVKVYVEGGKITNVRFVDRRFMVKPEMDQYMTLTEMFDYAWDHYKNNVAQLDISYSTEYGFIDNIYVDEDLRIADEEMGIKITDFEVMDISIPEPPIQVDCVSGMLTVNIVDKKYVFNSTEGEDEGDIGILETQSPLNVGLNMYQLTDIPVDHPIGIHTNSDDVGIMSEKLIEIKPHGDIVINVSGGSMSSPHYTFKLEDGTDISSDVYSGDFKFMKKKMYVFKNAGVSGVHPFKIGKSRDIDLDWVNGTQLDSQTSEITMKIPHDYDGTIIYYCKNHPTMTSNSLGILSKTALNGEKINFYYGDIEVCVNGDFGTTSYECYYHGYMGGENNLVFSEFCGKPLSEET